MPLKSGETALLSLISRLLESTRNGTYHKIPSTTWSKVLRWGPRFDRMTDQQPLVKTIIHQGKNFLTRLQIQVSVFFFSRLFCFPPLSSLSIFFGAAAQQTGTTPVRAAAGRQVFFLLAGEDSSLRARPHAIFVVSCAIRWLGTNAPCLRAEATPCLGHSIFLGRSIFRALPYPKGPGC